MKELKRALLRCFFVIEIIVFCMVYAFGTHGLPYWRTLEQELQQLRDQTKQLEHERSSLHDELAYIKRYPYARERIARERLHMARPTDTVFLFKERSDVQTS